MKFNGYFIKFSFLLIVSALSFGCQRYAYNAPATTSNQNSAAINSLDNSSPVRSTHSSETGEASAEKSNLTWQLVDGNVQSLGDLKGQAVILDFWATYCPPCEEEIPHLVELSNRYKNQNLEVIGLHVGGPEDRANIVDFVTKYEMKYSLAYPNQDLMDFYLQGDDRIPQTFVFDRKGQLVQKFVGFTPEIKSNLDAAVQKALEIN